MARNVRRFASILLAAGLLATRAVGGEIELGQVIADGSGGATLLEGTQGIATSPDGRHVYATGAVDDGIVVFARSRVAGLLTFVAQYQNGVGGVQGLDGPAGLAITRDGLHVYVTGIGSLAVFARDALTGLLTFVEFHQDGVLGVDGLGGARLAVVSPDGAHVYVGASGDGAIVIFSRSAASGALTYLGLVRDGEGGVDGLSFLVDVVPSPDGAFLYAAGSSDDAVAIFSRSGVTGLLTYLGLVRDGEGDVVDLQSPQQIAIPSDGRHLYAATSDAVVSFSRNQATGDLAFIESRPDLAPASRIVASRDGRLVFSTSGTVANYRLSVLARDEVTSALTLLDVRQNGVDGVTLSPVASLAESPDGQHLYAASSAAGAVNLFSRRVLYFREVQKNGLSGATGLSVPVGVAWSPDGRHAYVAGSGSDAVVAFAFEAATESLAFVEAEFDGAGGGPTLASPRDVVVSPDGKHVYVVAFADDAITTFSRDALSGALNFVSARRDGFGGVEYMDGPLGVTMSSDGARVIVASQEGIAIFSRNAETGVLSYFSNAVADSLPNAVAASPDGKHVYLSAPGANAITVLAYDTTTGFHDHVQSVYDQTGGVSGLANALELVVSPDGKHVYVSTGTGVVIFARDAATGTLAFADHVENGVDGVRGLVGPRGVAISPDGRFVLVTNFSSDSVAAFARDPTSGLLAFAQVEFDGVDGVDGLDGGAGVAVAPNGRHVLAAGRGADDALVLFAPEPGAAVGLIGAIGALAWIRRRRVPRCGTRPRGWLCRRGGEG